MCGEDVHVREICKRMPATRISTDSIVEAETTILERCNFHLVCYEPFRVLEGLILRGRPSLREFPKRYKPLSTFTIAYVQNHDFV